MALEQKSVITIHLRGKCKPVIHFMANPEVDARYLLKITISSLMMVLEEESL